MGSTPSAGAQGGAPPVPPSAAAPAAVVSSPASASGSPSAPAGLTATVEAGDESSTDSFHWDGDDEGADFKPNGSVSMYPPSTLDPLGPFLPSPIPSAPSCSWVSLELDPSSLLDVDHSPDDIILPPGLVSALHRAISPEEFWRDFDWSWRILVPRTTWSRTAQPSFHTRRFGTFVFLWVPIPLLLSWDRARPSFCSTGSAY